MAYPNFNGISKTIEMVKAFAELKHESGAEGVSAVAEELKAAADGILAKVKALPVCPEKEAKEPDELSAILALRPDGPRKLWSKLDPEVYRKKLKGALYARMAGCTLGAIVEGWPPQEMENWAKYIGDAFPPTDYWSDIISPHLIRCNKSYCYEYTRGKMDGVPTDDDIAYTLLGLLIAEESGLDFTACDVGKAWVKYLPFACTAEEVTLANLKKGISAHEAAIPDNPFVQWIGADIRSDPWAYMSPAYPEKAARLAYNDAYISHRRNGIYGEMFFSAAQSAAFAVDNAVDALKIGLTEIPKDCALTNDVKWALEAGKSIKNHSEARAAVEEKFKGMSAVHTNNNACLTIFGLMIGGNDVTKVLSEIVAMGYDNDCTAATAGSIIGAIVGIDGVPGHWYKNFNNKVHSYLIGQEVFAADDLLRRFEALARRIYE
jgi:ADP-ribosylglycohydrolase